jgi:uncharacterized protein (UPF0332 family)
MTDYNLNWFFETRKLRKIPVDAEKVKRSLEIAQMKLNESKQLFSLDLFSNSLLSSYTSMFHCARAILYKEGIQEKSHYATYFYLKEKFGGKISKNLLVSFNHYRVIRHELLYGYPTLNKEDAESAVSDAENFLNEVKIFLK